MARTPLAERELPVYSRGEERLNTLTHILGGVMGLAILVRGLMTASEHQNPWAVVGCAIYGASMILLYAVSSLYHGLPAGKAKRLLRIFDHCTIYALIAGTYTPILLAAVRPIHPALAWTILGCEWGLGLLAAVLTAIDLKKYSKLSMACYIGMGWIVVVALKPTLEAVTLPGFLWLLAGGVAYTVGAVLYVKGKKRKWFHTVFHVFVVLGSALQAVCILNYVL